MSLRSSLFNVSVDREKAYDDALASISGSFERMDEIDSAIEWAIIHLQFKPRKSMVTIKPNCYVWRLRKISNKFPDVAVAFALDESERKIYLVNLVH